MAAQGLSSEQALLGSMLRDERIVPDVIHAVREEDFGLDADRVIFAAMRDMYIHGKPIDGVTVRTRVGQEYSDYLLQLLELTPTAANWEAYAEGLRDDATKRRVREYAQKLLDAPDTAQYGPLLENIRRLSVGKRRFEIYDAAQLYQHFIERQSKGEDKNYVRYGMRELDDAVHTRIGHVVVLAARPGHGKTAFALQIAREIAKTRRVGFFSLETGAEDIEDRMVAEAFGIGMSASTKYRLTQKDWDTLAARSEEMTGRMLRIIPCGRVTAAEIIAEAEACEFEVIFVDYLQLVIPADSRQTRNEQIAQISRDLHAFAQSSPATLVFELSQLSRPDSKSGWRQPDLPDLRESGQIEQDADTVMFIFRPPEGDKKYDVNAHRYIKVAKQKNGPRNTLVAAFDGEHQKFAMIDHTHEESQKIMRGYIDAGNQVKRRRTQSDGQVRFEELPESEAGPFR